MKINGGEAARDGTAGGTSELTFNLWTAPLFN
jgi:hypothetical protein